MFGATDPIAIPLRTRKTFSAQIAALEGALNEARGAQRLELQGYAIQPDGVRGIWSDQWAGVDVAVTIVPTRDMRALQLEVWVPPQISEAQQLQIVFGDTHATRDAATGKSTRIVLPLKAKAGEVVPLHIQTNQSWMPSADGSSSDERPLAYRILSAVIVH